MQKYLKSLQLVALISFGGLSVYGQQSLILKLKLVEKGGNIPITFAKISIIDGHDKTYQVGVSDAEGKCNFILADTLNGKLKIYTSPLGYEKFISLPIYFKGNTFQDTIYLEKKEITLDEVIVFQKKIAKDGDKLIYRPEITKFSSSTAIVELFSKLPGVSLSSGKLKLNGNEGVLVLIDGKGELKSQEQQLEMLTGISSDKIDKIEITATTSSKYEANIASIINVITKKDKGSSTTRINLSQPLFMDEKALGSKMLSPGGSTNLNFKIFNIKTSLIFNANYTQSCENSEYQRTIYNRLSYSSVTNSAISRFSLSPNLTLDYDLDSRSSVGFNADISIVPSLKRNTIESYNFTNQTGVVDSTVNINNDYNNKRSSVVLNGNYKYLLNKVENSNLYLNIIYSYNPYKVQNFLNKISNFNEQPIIGNNFDSHTNILNVSVIVADLIKFGSFSTEFGLKSNTLNNDTYQTLKLSTSKFIYKEQLSSMFFSTRYKFGSYLLLTGVRGEQLNSTSIFNENDIDEKLKQDYFKIYPNLLLQKNLNTNLTTSIGYTKKIRRPFINDLNPTGRINNYFNSFAGNLNYKPIYTDRFEAQLRYKDLGLTLYYEKSSTKPLFLPTEDPFKFKATNLDKLNKIAISLDKAFEIAHFLTANLNVNYAYFKHTKTDVSYFKSSFNLFEISGSFDLTLGKKTKLQAEYYYTPKMYTEYSVFGGLISSSITLRQLLLKDKWSMNITLADPFGIEKNKSTSFYDSQFERGASLTNQRIISLQMIYNFPFGQKFKNQNYRKKIDGEVREQQ